MKITGYINIENRYIEIEVGYDKSQIPHTFTGAVAYPFIGIGFQIWKIVFALDINYITAGKDLLNYLNKLIKR